jgi:hypothetical protein
LGDKTSSNFGAIVSMTSRNCCRVTGGSSWAAAALAQLRPSKSRSGTGLDRLVVLIELLRFLAVGSLGYNPRLDKREIDHA